jgi:hypothetical protein
LLSLGGISAATSDLSTPTAHPAVTSVVGAAPIDFPTGSPCPIQGDGGDPALNEQKNRYVQPTAAQIAPSIKGPADIIELPAPQGVGKQLRANWNPKDAATIEGYEAMGATIEGKLVRITPENKPKGESVNCHRYQVLYDFHIFVADTPGVGIDQAVVVEMTPRWR